MFHESTRGKFRASVSNRAGEIIFKSDWHPTREAAAAEALAQVPAALACCTWRAIGAFDIQWLRRDQLAVFAR